MQVFHDMEINRNTKFYLKVRNEPQMSKKKSKYGCIMQVWLKLESSRKLFGSNLLHFKLTS